MPDHSVSSTESPTDSKRASNPNDGNKVSQAHIQEYQRDGAVLLPGLLIDWVDTLCAGIERNMREPGEYASENVTGEDTGRFFDDYCNWKRIPEFEQVITQSSLAEAAAALMDSQSVQLFHDHVLVKEPGTSKSTPWHQDSPYYFVDGMQNVSFWCPVDAVSQASLRCVTGSHLWEKPVLPVKWLAEDSFYSDTDQYQPVPNPDEVNLPVKEWAMEPGDVVAFHFKSLHGARGNHSTSRRRAFSLRLVGDDARYITRPGKTSPPFPGHNMADGQRLREDWFPIVYPN